MQRLLHGAPAAAGLTPARVLCAQALQDDATARQAAKQAAAAKKAACRGMLEQQMADNTYRR